MDCSPPGSSTQGILQARILQWVAISFSRVYSQPRDRTCVSCNGRWIAYHWATREALILTLGICKSSRTSTELSGYACQLSWCSKQQLVWEYPECKGDRWSANRVRVLVHLCLAVSGSWSPQNSEGWWYPRYLTFCEGGISAVLALGTRILGTN